MSDEQKTNVPLIGEIFVEGEAPPQYYQAFLNAQAKAEEAADRAEGAAARIVVDQEYIETQVFSAGQAANAAATAANDAAESERNVKDNADRAADAANSAEASAIEALLSAEEVKKSAPVSYAPQTMSKEQKATARANIGAVTQLETEETVYPVLEQGSIYSSNGQLYDNQARLRSFYIPIEDVITVASNNSEYDLYVYFYDNDKKLRSTTGAWVDDFAMADITDTEARYFRIVARKKNESPITPADAIGIFGVTQKMNVIGAEAVRYVPQYLTPAQQAQAMENIGASNFYHTKREKLGDEYTDTEKYKSKYIYGRYDALMAKYPNNVQKLVWIDETASWSTEWEKYQPAEGTFVNYQYVISTGDYSTDAVYVQQYGNNPPIKKPKYLILSGIHGRERRAVFSTYRFIRDLLSGHNISQGFREGVIISVMPIGTPSSFDAFDRYTPTVKDENGNVVKEGVNICRNFDWNWTKRSHAGASAASEKETQAIQNWLNANADAALFIDHHNNGALNEKVIILGMPYNSTSNTARKIALRGVNNIIPFWRDVIRYPKQVKAEGLDGEVKYRDTIFSYSATLETGGLSITYAQNVVGIPSIAIETSSFYGDHTNFATDMKTDSPEAVAMGAEALGNILLEFYKQEFAPIPEVGTPIYNGEALLNINRVHTQIYNGEEE